MHRQLLPLNLHENNWLCCCTQQYRASYFMILPYGQHLFPAGRKKTGTTNVPPVNRLALSSTVYEAVQAPDRNRHAHNSANGSPY